MRMEDPEQVQLLQIDPFECLQLLVWIHHKPHRALGLVSDEKHLLDPSIFSGQQSAGFERGMFCHVLEHFSILILENDQLGNHSSG